MLSGQQTLGQLTPFLFRNEKTFLLPIHFSPFVQPPVHLLQEVSAVHEMLAALRAPYPGGRGLSHVVVLLLWST